MLTTKVFMALLRMPYLDSIMNFTLTHYETLQFDFFSVFSIFILTFANILVFVVCFYLFYVFVSIFA